MQLISRAWRTDYHSSSMLLNMKLHSIWLFFRKRPEVIALTPFVFPAVQIVDYAWWYDHLPFIVADLLTLGMQLVLIVEVFFLSKPFEALLYPLGPPIWSRGPAVLHSAPLLLGSFIIAIVYSMLILIIIRGVKLWRKRARNST